MRREDPSRPFDAIRHELQRLELGQNEPPADHDMRLDLDRRARTGIPEVVYAEFKTTEQVIAGLRELVARNGRALAARCRADTISAVENAFPAPLDVSADRLAGTVVVADNNVSIHSTGGVIGVIAAGTSDGPVAREAGIMAQEMGCSVVAINDVGVAGLHRLVVPLERLAAEPVGAIVVAAGMDGALPSVVAGLVAVPVIGLPTSVGYGYGGNGEAALGTMLQTCAPGLVVVNIDNGIGAGASAALIANRFSQAKLR